MNKKLIFFIAILLSSLFISAWVFRGGKNQSVVVKDNRTEKLEGEKDNLEKEKEEVNIEKEESAPEAKEESSTSSVSKEDSSSEAQSENDSPEAEEASKADFKIKNRLFSWGYGKATGRKIDTIVLHSTYNAIGGDEFDLDKIIGIYKSYGVAPHYIVARDGKIYRTVEDKNIAYHAGESKTPDGRKNVNEFSIGIEIINSKTQGPTEAQYNSLKQLLSQLKGQYKIKYTLGHSDIAPGRKDDPWKFEWGKVK